MKKDKSIIDDILNGEVAFKNQDEKIEAIGMAIEVTRSCLKRAIQERSVEGTVQLKIITTFLEEYRDVLEQIDIEWE